MNCNTTHYRANSSSVPGDPTGRGTTFRFAIRLGAATEAGARETPTAAIVGYAGERRRILVVDDIAVNRGVVVDLVKPLGFDVQEASSGAHGLRLADEFRPHLVFLDLRMPGMTGFELAAKLRDAFGDTPSSRPKLIAMSASVLSFNRDNAFAAGCDDFLPKPFHERELLDRLERHLGLTWIRGAIARRETEDNVAAPLEPAALEGLLAAARRGEVNRLREHLAGLAARDPQFVAEAESLLKAYRMDALRQLLEQRLQAVLSR